MGPTELQLHTHRPVGQPDPLWGSVEGRAAAGRQALLAAGDMLIYDARLRHRGGANVSPRRRRLLYVSIRRRSVALEEGTLHPTLAPHRSLGRTVRQ